MNEILGLLSQHDMVQFLFFRRLMTCLCTQPGTLDTVEHIFSAYHNQVICAKLEICFKNQ